SAFAGALGGHLGRKRRTLARTAETTAARGTPGQDIALTIGNRNDRIVECRVYERDTVTHVAAPACLAGPRAGAGACGHITYLYNLMQGKLAPDRPPRTFARA